MSRRSLTEPAAWRAIARLRFAHPSTYRRHGLCHQVRELFQARRISAGVAKWMLDRLTSHLATHRGRTLLHAYYIRARGLPNSVRTFREANAGRLLAALWLELEARAESSIITPRSRTPRRAGELHSSRLSP